MQNYRMTVQYDGTRYNGWQKQGNTDNTIQGKLETLLTRMTDSPVTVQGAGRTDAGVHAKGQVAHFHADTEMTCTEIRDYLNTYLPDDIGVSEVVLASPRFHSRLNATSKTYVYRIARNKPAHIFDRRFVSLYEGELNVMAMKTATLQLIGEHDFKSFCGNPRIRKSTVRTIRSIRITDTEDEITITYTGTGFLQYMVRILTGTLIEVGEEKRNPYAMKDLLAAKDRAQAGPTAPACGLTLLEVRYD